MHLSRSSEAFVFFPTVGEAVPGERRIRKIAKDPSTTSSVMPGNEVFFLHVYVLAVTFWVDPVCALFACVQSRLWLIFICRKTTSQCMSLSQGSSPGDARSSPPCDVILCVSLQTDDGEDDLKKGTQLLEIYALEIQMYTAQKNNKKLKALYEQSLHIKSAIPHPLIMGVIRGELLRVLPSVMLRVLERVRDVCPASPPECGGKMHLREGEFEKAHTDFFEAFKNYDESGSPRRTTCLKYLVLANMLMKSGINPFDSQEV